MDATASSPQRLYQHPERVNVTEQSAETLGMNGCCISITSMAEAKRSCDKVVADALAYYYGVLRDQTGRYQLLCANCNAIKRFENKLSSLCSARG